MVLGHHLRHHFDWALVIKTLARPNIEFVCDCVQLLLGLARQIRTLGQILADQAIDVFVAAALPGAVRVAEVNSHAGALSDFGMACHLAALVIRQRLARSQRHAIQRRAEAFHGRRGSGAMHPHQHQVTRTALNKRADCGCIIALAFDKVALPMTGRQTIFRPRRADMDTDEVRDLATTIYSNRAGAAAGSALAQADDQLLAKLAHRPCVDGVVDGLAADINVFKL
jgi:hypothetical protein